MPKRTWTLAALQAALAKRLAPLPPPSLPTLKQWSRAGKLPSSSDLDAACADMVQRIRSGALQVRGPRNVVKTPISTVGARAPSLRSTANAPTDALPTHTAYSAPSDKHPHPNSTPAALLATDVVRAIEQLEATRRHILLQWDALRQSLEQASAKGPAAPSAGIDFLEWQRMLARLGRLEEMVAQIARAVAAGSRSDE